MARAAGNMEQAIAKFDQGDHEGAEAIFASEWKSDNQNAVAAFYLGRIEFDRDKFDTAGEWFDRTIELDDSNPDHHYWWARAFGRKARNSNLFVQMRMSGKIKRAFEKTVELDPDHIDARDDLVSFYIRVASAMGRSMEKALDMADAVAKLDAKRGVEVRVRVYRELKDAAAIEKILREAVRKFPEDPDFPIDLGVELAGAENYDEAFGLFEKTIEKFPHAPRAYYQIGWTAAESGKKVERGVTALRHYLTGEPDEDMPSKASAHQRLGMLYEKLSRLDQAKQEYQAALRLDPDHKQAKASLRKLR